MARTGRKPQPPGRFLKWAGGKSQLLRELLKRSPKRFRVYYEPFLGSAALFFALREAERLGEVRLSDTNRHLHQVYEAIATDVEGVIEVLRGHRYEHDYYYELRAQDPEGGTMSAAERAARFIYINRAGYNGLYRENKKGVCNVPFGRHTNPTLCDEETLRIAAEALRGVSVRREDFAEAVASAGEDDFVYFDPPYVPVSRTASFTSYSQGGFDEAEQRRLAATFDALAARGARVMLSNSDAPLVHELYAGHHIRRVPARRAINSKAERRGAVYEVIVTSY